MVQCTCGIVYMLCRWFHVHVMLCTCCVGGAVYKWCVYMLYIWYWFKCGIVCVLCCKNMILCMCIVQSWYRDICIHCVVLRVHICVVLYTRCRCMYCVVVYTGCRSVHCVVLYTRCRCMCHMASVGVCIAWCCILCVVVCV